MVLGGVQNATGLVPVRLLSGFSKLPTATATAARSATWMLKPRNLLPGEGGTPEEVEECAGRSLDSASLHGGDDVL